MGVVGSGGGGPGLRGAFLVLAALGACLVGVECIRVAAVQVTGRDDPALVALSNTVIPVVSTAMIAVIGLMVKEIMNGGK